MGHLPASMLFIRVSVPSSRIYHKHPLCPSRGVFTTQTFRLQVPARAVHQAQVILPGLSCYLWISSIFCAIHSGPDCWLEVHAFLGHFRGQPLQSNALFLFRKILLGTQWFKSKKELLMVRISGIKMDWGVGPSEWGRRQSLSLGVPLVRLEQSFRLHL